MNIRVCLVTVFIAVNLIGCGNKKSSSTPDVPPEVGVPLRGMSLTVEGLVEAEEPKPNVDVSFAIGDKTFTTKTDVKGMYKVTLEVDEAHAAIPVRITAQIDPAQPKYILLSVLNSPQVLIEQAGSDDVLTFSENRDVDLSFVTTAYFAQMPVFDTLGGNIPLNSDADLSAALVEISPTKTLNIATYLYMAATDIVHSSKPVIESIDYVQSAGEKFLFFYAEEGDEADRFYQIRDEIASKANYWIMPEALAGDFIVHLYGGAIPVSYKMTFRSDNTGLVEPGIKFRWKKSQSTRCGVGIELEFDYVNSPEIPEELMPWGQQAIKSAELYFTRGQTYGWSGQFMLSSAGVSERDKCLFAIGRASWPNFDAKIYDLSKSIIPKNGALLGDWYDRSFDNRLTSLNFGQDNKLSMESLAGFLVWPNQSKYVAEWRIESGFLNVRNEEGQKEIYFLEKDIGVGFTYTKWIVWPQASGSSVQEFYGVTEGVLIKKQTGLKLVDSVIEGFWLGGNSLHINTKEGFGFTDIGYKAGNWRSSVDGGGWEQDFRDQVASYNPCLNDIESASGCASGVVIRRYPVARSENTYYFLDAIYERDKPKDVGMPADNSLVPNELTPNLYSLSILTKIPKITGFGPWMESAVPKTFFQDTDQGVKVWVFSENRYWVGNKIGDLSAPGVNFVLRQNRLQYSRDDIDLEMQLIMADDQGIRVCEYPVGQECSLAGIFYLSNRSPVIVSLDISGPGTIKLAQFNSYFELPNFGLVGRDEVWNEYGNRYYFKIVPNDSPVAGKLESLSGCQGTILNGYYVTEPLFKPCQIVAKFQEVF